MSIGPLVNIAGSIAGSPLAQATGSEVERSGQEAGAEQRRVQSDRKADAAAGIGETDGQDHEPAERDADGRRPWEAPPEKKPDDNSDDAQSPPGTKQSKDTTGQSGNLLDLTG
jgi:hypothetical protein